MNLGKAIFIGLCYMGVQIDGIDKNKNIVYISVPEESVYYNSTIKTPQDLARSIKEKVLGSKFKVKYRVRDENWTAEKRKQAIDNIKMNYWENNYGGMFERIKI